MRNLIRGAIALVAASQVVLGTASFASAQVDITCASALSNVVVQNVIVPMGAACTLTDVTVLGNIEVKENARVTTRRGSINGDVIGEAGSQVRLNRGNVNGGIIGNGARLVNINGTTIARDVTALETVSLVVASGARVGSIEVLKGGSASINNVQISGGVKFEENTGAISASGNRVAGNFEAYLNTGGATFNSNVITGNMQCKDNLPAPTGSGNTAASKEDQCAAL
jgi:hypothetical protein